MATEKPPVGAGFESPGWSKARALRAWLERFDESAPGRFWKWNDWQAERVSIDHGGGGG